MADTGGLAVHAPDLAGDELFDPASRRNRDGWFCGFHELRRQAEAVGWTCHTHDWFVERSVAPRVVLYLDIPPCRPAKLQAGWAPSAEPWVVLQESELIIPRNWRQSRQADFARVFTWHDDFVDRPGYRRLNFSVPLDEPGPHEVPFEERKLCTMIAGNKRVRHPLELYTDRVRAIEWFERNHPEDFDLYGRGWDRFTFAGPKLVRALNLVEPLRRVLARPHPTYRGAVDRKSNVLPRYRFAICFENARDIPGYITEKILECFTAGVVPVYRGPARITDVVPAAAFVDMREFESFDELYGHIRGMGEAEHQAHLDAARDWLRSPAADAFRPSRYGATIVKELLALDQDGGRPAT